MFPVRSEPDQFLSKFLRLYLSDPAIDFYTSVVEHDQRRQADYIEMNRGIDMLVGIHLEHFVRGEYILNKRIAKNGSLEHSAEPAPCRVEIDERQALRGSRPGKSIANECRDIPMFRYRDLPLARGMLHPLRPVTKAADLFHYHFRINPCRVVGDRELVVSKFHSHFGDTVQSIQDQFYRIGSAVSRRSASALHHPVDA
jgi:hypothetical protein